MTEKKQSHSPANDKQHFFANNFYLNWKSDANSLKGKQIESAHIFADNVGAGPAISVDLQRSCVKMTSTSLSMFGQIGERKMENENSTVWNEISYDGL